MPSLDFHNPVMSASITTPSGQRVPLWTLPTTMDRSALNLGNTAALSFLTEISVEIQLGYVPIIKATLTPPYRDALNLLDKNCEVLSPGQSVLSVVFGYVGKGGPILRVPPYQGLMLLPDVSLGQDVQITINAQGLGGFAATREDGMALGPSAVQNLGIGLATSQQSTRKSIVTSLLGNLTPPVFVDDSEVTQATGQGDAEVLQQWSKVPIEWASGGETVWTSVNKLLREASLFSYWTSNSAGNPSLKILPASKVFAAKTSRLFRVYDYANGLLGGPTSPVFPILSANSPTTAAYLSNSARGMFSQEIDSAKRSISQSIVGDAQTAAPRTDEGGASVSGQNPQFSPGDPNDPRFVQESKSDYLQQTQLMGVALTLESLGDPTINPGDTIDVRGLGTRIDGIFSVFKVTHTIGNAGYTMSLECVSNTSKELANAVLATGPVAPPVQQYSDPVSALKQASSPTQYTITPTNLDNLNL